MKTEASYQIVFLGHIDGRADYLISLLSSSLSDLGLSPSTISYFVESQKHLRNPRLPTIPVFLGYDGAEDHNHLAIAEFIDNSNIFITVVTDLKKVSIEIPVSLRKINAIAIGTSFENFDRTAALVLEGFRLLRRERKLFISYKREDSQALANQLYDALDGRGFDVFIDTRSVPPAIDFQEVLWHRLSDSDVVVLIDTPEFRKSRWTKEELARANMTNIQILHLLWPGQPEDSESSFSHFHTLSTDHFKSGAVLDKTSTLIHQAVDDICMQTERMRARAIQARYNYLLDGFCDAVRDCGLNPDVQPQRWISVQLSKGKELAVVPTIGIPTSERINLVYDDIKSAGNGTAGIWVLYDNRGVLKTWLEHLAWLDVHLPIRTFKMTELPSLCAALKEATK
jgi:hypothetical protein